MIHVMDSARNLPRPVETRENVISDLKNIKVTDTPKPSYDDVVSFKEIIFLSDFEEDFAEGKRLTSLVRESYLKHVRQLLNQNYKVWCEVHEAEIPLKEEKSLISSTDIEKCVKFLEQKALRACMITSLYQKTMIELISNIKRSTKEKKLFDNLNKIGELNVFTSDKCSQTDAIETCNIECQTDDNNTVNERRIRCTSLLDLPLPDPKDVLQSLGSDFISGNSIDHKTSSSTNHAKDVAKKINQQPVKPVCRVAAKRPSYSDDFSAESKRRKSCSSGLSSSNNCVPNKSSSKEVIDNFDLICMLTDNNKINSNDSFNSNNNLIDIVGDLSELESELNKCLPSDNQPQSNMEKLYDSANKSNDENLISLDDRLAEMGILANEDSVSSFADSKKTSFISPLNYVKGRRNSWFVEMTAYYCNLAQIFFSLSDSRRTKVTAVFKKMFGSDDDDYTVLTDDKLSICRKRTANMVVAGLTPYFEAKRIGSRYLFKEFAKRVTNSIMSRTYVPDSRAVNQFITEYFCEHNSVDSVEDIDFDC